MQFSLRKALLEYGKLPFVHPVYLKIAFKMVAPTVCTAIDVTFLSNETVFAFPYSFRRPVTQYSKVNAECKTPNYKPFSSDVVPLPVAFLLLFSLML